MCSCGKESVLRCAECDKPCCLECVDEHEEHCGVHPDKHGTPCPNCGKDALVDDNLSFVCLNCDYCEIH